MLCYWPEMSRLASVDIMLMNASLFELIPFLVHSIDFSSGGCWGGGERRRNGWRNKKKTEAILEDWQMENRDERQQIEREDERHRT